MLIAGGEEKEEKKAAELRRRLCFHVEGATSCVGLPLVPRSGLRC